MRRGGAGAAGPGRGGARASRALPAGAAVRGARARVGAGQSEGRGRRRHAPRVPTCPRLGSGCAASKSRARGQGGCEEAVASASPEGRLQPGKKGGLGAPRALLPRAAAFEPGGESRVTAGSLAQGRGGGSNKGSRVKVASPGASTNLCNPCKAALVRSAPRFASDCGNPWFGVPLKDPLVTLPFSNKKEGVKGAPAISPMPPSTGFLHYSEKH